MAKTHQNGRNDLFEAAARVLGELVYAVDYTSQFVDGELNLWYVLVEEELERELESHRNLQQAPREKRTRVSSPKEDYHESSLWKKFIARTDWTTGNQDKEFRGCFRLPYEMFLWFVSEAKAKDWFPGKGDHFEHNVVAGVQRKPLELLILSSLSYLAGTASWKMLQHATTISSTTNRAFFALFIQHLAGPASIEEWLTPNEGEKAESARMFSAAGLEGCWCAADGVHIRVWSCSHSLKNLAKGKEGFTSYAFNVVCLSSGKIISCSRAFLGCHPDTTLVKNHKFMLDLQNNLHLPNTVFMFHKVDGTTTTEHQPWCIVDGGYVSWISTLAPPKSSSHIVDVVLAKWMESVRKIIECVFGMLKQRWRILKFGLTIQDESLCEGVMWAACVLQNMILNWAQTRSTEAGRAAAVEDNVLAPAVPEVIYTRSLSLLPPGYQLPARMGSTPYEERMFRLAEHFYVMLLKGEVRWPSRKAKGRFPRTEFDLHKDDDDDDPNAEINELVE